MIALAVTTDDPDEDEDEFDEDDDSSEADDDSRIYKNPRNSPSSDCPRDEEQVRIYCFRCILFSLREHDKLTGFGNSRYLFGAHSA